jgi:hypothetical protein
MVLMDGLQEPVNITTIDDATKEAVSTLIAQGYPGAERYVERRFYSRSFRRGGRPVFFLGRSQEGKVAAIGCMEIYEHNNVSTAFIREVVVDGAIRTAEMERSIFNRLVSWAAFLFRVDVIKVDDRACLVSKEVFLQAMFHHYEGSHLWRRSNLPSGDHQ